MYSPVRGPSGTGDRSLPGWSTLSPLVIEPRFVTVPCGEGWALGFQKGAEFGQDGRGVRPCWVWQAREAFVKGFREHGDRVEASFELGLQCLSANTPRNPINPIRGLELDYTVSFSCGLIARKTG